MNTQLGTGTDDDGLIVEFGIDNRGNRINVRIPGAEDGAVHNVVDHDVDDHHDEDSQGIHEDPNQPVS